MARVKAHWPRLIEVIFLVFLGGGMIDYGIHTGHPAFAAIVMGMTIIVIYFVLKASFSRTY